MAPIHRPHACAATTAAAAVITPMHPHTENATYVAITYNALPSHGRHDLPDPNEQTHDEHQDPPRGAHPYYPPTSAMTTIQDLVMEPTPDGR